MARLHDRTTPTEHGPPSEFQQILIDHLNEIRRSMSAGPLLWASGQGVDEQARIEFFRDYYIKPDSGGSVPLLKSEPPEPLSLIEASILSHLLDKASSRERVFLLCEHAGRGKSTILSYLSFSLLERWSELSSNLVPIYLSIYEHDQQIKALPSRDAIYAYLDREIQTVGSDLAYSALVTRPAECLGFLHRLRGGGFHGAFPKRKIDQIAGNVEEWVADQPETVREQLRFGALTFAAATGSRRLAVLIDDADRLESDTQRFCLQYLHRLRQLGFATLLSLRRSTYELVRREIRDKEHLLSPPIGVTQETIRHLLAQRIRRSSKRMVIRWKSRWTIPAEKAVKGFTDLLSHPDAMDLLTSLSNENLHSLFEKVGMIAESVNFRDTYVLRQALSNAQGEGATRRKLKLWIFFSLLFGNYRGTFKSNDTAGRAGIVNLFCTRDRNHHPYTFFVRLHVLSHLVGHETEELALRGVDIRKRYQEIFDYDPHFTSVVTRTLRRLYLAGLVHTTSCRRYQSEAVFAERIWEDSLFLSTAGQYSIQRLFKWLDYFWFMKDDIDWRDGEDTGLEPASPRQDLERKVSTSLDALLVLANTEYQMLQALHHASARRAWRIYLDDFSPFRLGAKTALFTEMMLNSFEAYLVERRPSLQALASDARARFGRIEGQYPDIYSATRRSHE